MISSILLVIIIILLSFFIFKQKEQFNVTNEHQLYMRYRDYINGRSNHLNHQNKYKNNYPRYFNRVMGLRKVSGNCFIDKFSRCNKNKTNCITNSFAKCLGPPMVSGSI